PRDPTRPLTWARAALRPGESRGSERGSPYLPGVVTEWFVDTLDAARKLVGGEPLAEMRKQHIIGGRFDQLDQRMRNASEVLMGQADHAARTHRGVLVERGLDLRRVDVGPADQDHVGIAVREIDESFVVEVSEIAQRLPPVGCGLGGSTDVAVRRGQVLAAPHPDFADLE